MGIQFSPVRKSRTVAFWHWSQYSTVVANVVLVSSSIDVSLAQVRLIASHSATNVEFSQIANVWASVGTDRSELVLIKAKKRARILVVNRAQTSFGWNSLLLLLLLLLPCDLFVGCCWARTNARAETPTEF